MLAFVVVLAAAALLLYLLGGAPALRIDRKAVVTSVDAKIAELSEYAERLRQTNKYLSAEKVYLQILKIDHKHVPTYTRLGTLYSALKNYGDAIECLEIAAQLSPSALTHYNLALGLYENRNYMKSIAAFEKSIMFEPSAPRYIGLAKAQYKVEGYSKTVEALESAVEIEETPKTLWLLYDAYRKVDRAEDAVAVKAKIRALNPRDPRLKELPRSPLEASGQRLEKTRL